jgi:hypothetical protein
MLVTNTVLFFNTSNVYIIISVHILSCVLILEFDTSANEPIASNLIIRVRNLCGGSRVAKIEWSV